MVSDTTTESGRAASLMARQLPGQPVSFELILSSAALRATDRVSNGTGDITPALHRRR